MKKIISCILFLPITVICSAQEVLRVQNGATLAIQPGVEMTIGGGITLENGSSVINNGTIRLKNNPVSNLSDWLDNSVTGALSGAGLVIFNSTDAHNFAGPTSFFDVSMNAPGNLTLNNNLTCTNTLQFTNGKIFTGSYYIYLTNNNAASLTHDVSNPNYINSWVNNNLRRAITTNTSTYDFPVGNASCNLLQFVNNNISGVSFLTASFGPKPGTDAGLNVSEGAPYTSVNNGGVWYFNANIAPSGGNYALQLYFNGFTGLSDNMFGILRRPDGSSNAAEWSVPTGSSLESFNGAGRKVSDGYARRKNITTFSQLGIGMSPGVLPIHLLDFTAIRENKKWVRLNWTTATETNNKGFEIERKFEYENQFANNGFVLTKALEGNSTGNLDYLFNDLNGYSGITYYRIKQVDKDNRFTYSIIKTVRGVNDGTIDVTIMPNPNKGQFKILITGVSDPHEAIICDQNGKIVRRENIQPQQTINILNLPAGIYFISIKDVFGKGMHFNEKIIVLH